LFTLTRQSPAVRLQLDFHENGFRLMARRDPVGIQLITRRGNDWTQRYPLRRP
jgi:hypothetical protein